MLWHLTYTSFIMKYSVYKEASMLRGINTAVNRLELHTPAGFQDQPAWNGPTNPHGRENHYRLSHLLTGCGCKLRGISFGRVFLL